jgi:hypothetical protein
MNQTCEDGAPGTILNGSSAIREITVFYGLSSAYSVSTRQLSVSATRFRYFFETYDHDILTPTFVAAEFGFLDIGYPPTPMSDDFSDSVKKTLAARAGHVCSNPECRVPTSGPQDDPGKAINLGVAAHITAASAGGPRYDPDLSHAERSAAPNGIWLCQKCAKLIDNDVIRFSVEVLRKWKVDAEAEARARLGVTTASSIGDVFIDVSVMNEDTSSWNRGADTILRYTLDRDGNRTKISSELGYLKLFKQGGPVGPLEYVMSPTRCPFRWDFPILDFKVLNNRQDPLFLTEIVFDIEESRGEPTPLLVIKRDTQQRHAGELHLINEGWCTLSDLKISFNLLPGAIATPTDSLPPYAHSIAVPLLEENIQVAVTQAFQDEGVDIEGLVFLSNGRWDGDVFVAQKVDEAEERMTEAEMQARLEKCFGRFREEVGTLVGEISFKSGDDLGLGGTVKFSAPVYLANENRMGIPRPPTCKYDIAFDTRRSNYQRRLEISHSLDPGEADRFTVKVAVAESSIHRFRATVRDISGLVLQSFPIEMSCFVPRSRRKVIESLLSPGA